MPDVAGSSALWAIVQEGLRKLFPPEVYQMWFEPLTCVEEAEKKIILGAPNDFAAIWLQDNYQELLSAKCSEAAHRPVKAFIVTAEIISPAEPEVLLRAQPVSDRSSAPSRPRLPGNDGRPQRKQNSLNPRNVFDSFIVGPNSQLAHAACMAVAQAPAQAYNPLFLYGATGLGKTHLMQAVGHQILRQKQDARVAYVSSEKFTNEYITAIQENTLSKFRQRYRNADVLLIDDIHFLSGKERIQEEFFHTFNDLFESQKQIILSSDRPVSEISKLESRMVSRFQWGLVADIQAPDLETRTAILRSKAKTLQCDLPAEIFNFIAERITRNIRRLEGALLKVASYSSLTGKSIDASTVSRLLQDVLQEEAQHQVTIEIIQKRVVEHYQLRLSDMVSKRRPANIAFPRQIAMYLSRTLTKCPLQEIGENFGGRDHGTVIYACRTVENMMDQDESVRNVVEYLKSQIEKNA
jgi:chromosomal replication initiator protein